MSRAQGTLNSNKTKIAADFAPERKGDGEVAEPSVSKMITDRFSKFQVSGFDCTNMFQVSGLISVQAAIAKLDAALKDFQKTIQAGDKQAREQKLFVCRVEISCLPFALLSLRMQFALLPWINCHTATVAMPVCVVGTPPRPRLRSVADVHANCMILVLSAWSSSLPLVSPPVAQAVPEKQQNCLQYVSGIEEAMVKGFPFAVPPEYSGLPQLKAR